MVFTMINKYAVGIRDKGISSDNLLLYFLLFRVIAKFSCSCRLQYTTNCLIKIYRILIVCISIWRVKTNIIYYFFVVNMILMRKGTYYNKLKSNINSWGRSQYFMNFKILLPIVFTIVLIYKRNRLWIG